MPPAPEKVAMEKLFNSLAGSEKEIGWAKLKKVLGEKVIIKLLKILNQNILNF